MNTTLYYKTYTYTNKKNEKKQGVKFYLQVKDRLVPINQVWYDGDKYNNVNVINYAMLKAIAIELPDKQ